MIKRVKNFPLNDYYNARLRYSDGSYAFIWYLKERKIKNSPETFEIEKSFLIDCISSNIAVLRSLIFANAKLSSEYEKSISSEIT